MAQKISFQVEEAITTEHEIKWVNWGSKYTAITTISCIADILRYMEEDGADNHTTGIRITVTRESE